MTSSANNEMTATTSKNFPDLIHVDPITDLSVLPFSATLHGNDSSTASQHPSIDNFISTALNAAQAFAKEAKVKSSAGGSQHKSEGYIGKVTCQRWDAQTPKANTETWAVRCTRHQGKAVAGDATYDELAQTVWRNHSLNERDYTPTVKDAHLVCKWDVEGSVTGWQDCTMEIFETRHDIGPVLSNRLFTVLIIMGAPIVSPATENLRSFVVLSIPIELPGALEGRKYGTAKDVVHGAYASVETVYEVNDMGKHEIEWVMATASDAKGNLPMALQKRFIKGEVAKDVGFVLKWIAKKR